MIVGCIDDMWRISFVRAIKLHTRMRQQQMRSFDGRASYKTEALSASSGNDSGVFGGPRRVSRRPRDALRSDEIPARL